MASDDAALARLGLRLERDGDDLRALGLWDEAGPGDWSLLGAFGAAANPDLALRALVRLAERRPEGWARLRPDPELVRRAAVVAGASEALGDLVAKSSQAVAGLAGDLAPLTVGEVRDQAALALVTADVPAAALTALQRRVLLRIAARDLLGLAGTPAVAGELADLAEGIVAAVLDHVLDTAREPVRVALIGLGKLGGRELNYVSDIDVVFVHDGDLPAATRVCEQVLRLLGQVTPEGRAYEVDTNLRPQGRDGPLTRTLDSYRAYWERWARTWEFQALLKARPLGGDRELGSAFIDATEPYVWPDRLDPEAIAEIQRMKGVVERSKEVRKAGERQVKLAPGGLRDIEFAVQLLQLVHGRHDRTLRCPGTLPALGALADGGYIGEEDATAFAAAYAFLRTVEHRLQLANLRRTHTIPTDAAARRRLARAVGFVSDAERDELGRFDDELAHVRGLVRELHGKLFYRPLLERFAVLGADALLPVDGARLAVAAARERLLALGFDAADAALGHLEALAGGLTRRARVMRTLLPALLPAFAESPDPVGGLAAFRSLVERLEHSPELLRTLRDTPPVAELLASALGRSKVVGAWLERQPEVIAALADPTSLDAPDPAALRRQADGLLRRRQPTEATADGLRRLRRREVVRTALRDVTDRAGPAEVSTELTTLAEVCVDAAVRMVVPDDVRLAVIGMGKLGGRELGYGSDLDVLLVFEPADARDAALTAVDALLRVLSGITPEGQTFRIDLGLRPEGKDGAAARTLSSYAAYYERWAEPWELQALTQARPVAGDSELGAAFIEAVAPIVYPPDVPPERIAAVRRMKARVERERAGGGLRRSSRRPSPRLGVRTGDRIDVKLGPGGLSDVEWTAQLLQLRHGGRDPSLREPGTRAALERLAAAKLLPDEDVMWFQEGLDLLTRVRAALHLAGAKDADVVPPGPRDQERLARALGYPRPGTQDFLSDLGRAMRRVRKAHERGFYDA